VYRLKPLPCHEGSTPGGGSKPFLQKPIGVYRALESILVYFSREMNGTFPIEGVPSRWIGAAEELRFEADANGCLFRLHAQYPFPRIPCGAARSAPQYAQGNDASSGIQGNFKVRGSELFAIPAQADLPG
jgi:hypothetical protein